MTRSWADMLSRLLSNKSGAFRKLEAADLQLPWKPLWRALQKELWPKASAADPQRNLVNILLYVAEQSKRYYPAEDVPEMLDTFIPTLTHDVSVYVQWPLNCRDANRNLDYSDHYSRPHVLLTSNQCASIPPCDLSNLGGLQFFDPR
jgi:hypothetical protein